VIVTVDGDANVIVVANIGGVVLWY